METQDVLERHAYIELYRVWGPPQAYDFAITTYGFDQFVHAAISEYGKIWADVARCLVRDVLQNNGQACNHSIAEELDQPSFMIEHILKVMGEKNLINYGTSRAGGLYMYVHSVSPELRRKLEGNT